MADVREKLVELLKKIVPTVWYEDCEGNRHPKCDEIQCAECIAERLMAHGVTIQRWIPVTERLPGEDKLALMLCKNGAMFVGYCGISWNNFERRWHIKTALNSTKLLNKGRVTHWMPLPEAPGDCHGLRPRNDGEVDNG